MLELLAVDAHGPLVALGDTDLVSAALDLLTRVLSGVHVCGIARKGNQKRQTCAEETSFYPAVIGHHSAPAVSNPKSLLSTTCASVGIISAAQSCTALFHHPGLPNWSA